MGVHDDEINTEEYLESQKIFKDMNLVIGEIYCQSSMDFMSTEAQDAAERVRVFLKERLR